MTRELIFFNGFTILLMFHVLNLYFSKYIYSKPGYELIYAQPVQLQVIPMQLLLCKVKPSIVNLNHRTLHKGTSSSHSAY